MAEEFEIKPDKEQEKREQAKRDLAELQNLLEPEEDEDEEFDSEELEDDADDVEESSDTDADTQTDEAEAETEEPTSSTKTEEPKSEQELEEQRQADREQAEREAMLEQQIRRKQTEKALAEMQEKQRAEQAKAQQEQAAAEKAAQPKQTKKPVQKKPVQKKKQPAESKPRKTHRDAKLARKHRRQLVRMGTVLVVALVALVLIVSAVRGIAGGSSKKDNTKGKKATTSAVTNEQKDTNTPASQQETKQYLKIKDDTSLPAYAKEYPGLYATAATTQKKLSDKKVCYLTFDDGPSDTCTPKILDTLKKYNVKATFFVVTSEIDGNEKLIQRIIDEGHTLCIHANEHEYQKIYASPEAYLKDFAAAYDKIYALTGYKVQGFRFPGGSNGQLKHYGNYDAIIKEMNRRGFEYYDWNAYDHDAEGGSYSASQLAQYAVHEVSISSRNDVIVLMHDTYGKENTVKALPSIIEGIQKQGIECLPITKTTRPVHFSVNENTPAEYTEETKDSDKSSSSKSETKN